MSQPALAGSATAPFLRRAFDWWIAQVKHALPPTIFFFVGFNLILWTKRLILDVHGVEFFGFFSDMLAAVPPPEPKLPRRQRIRLLTRLNRLTEANPIEAFSERGSRAHAELVDILHQLASPPVVPSARA